MRRRSPRYALLATLTLVLLPLHAALAPQAYELRNLGLAQLENERAGDAEVTYRKLVEAAPRDPLGHANLAIALMRQQKFDEALAAVDRALELAPGRADLVAIKGETLMWKGDREAALHELRAAAERAPDDLETLYRLYRHASSMRGPEAEAATTSAIDRLAQLRPENLYVLFRVGQAAIAAGDRARASGAYLRVRELLWQTPEKDRPAAETAMESLLQALEAGDLVAARRPSMLIENVVKVTPMFQGGLKELTTGVQGVPVARFVDEPPRQTFGRPVPIELRVSPLGGATVAGDSAGGATSGGAAAGSAAAGAAATGRTTSSVPAARGLVLADLDGDEKIDAARLVAAPRPALELRFARDGLATVTSLAAPAAATTLAAVDLDNDGALDLIGAGGGLVVWRGDGKGGFRDDTAAFGLQGRRLEATALALDYDQEGDLDLAVVDASGRLDLLRNALAGPLEAVGSRALPGGGAGALPGPATALLASDLDRDGDPDLVALHARGVLVLDNLRQGSFANRTAEQGLAGAPGGAAMTIADLDNDGWPDLVVAGPGLAIWRNRRGVLERWSVAGDLPAANAAFDAVLTLDADNDGRLDLAVAGDGGLLVLTQPSAGTFVRASVDRPFGAVAAIAAGDLDGDGDLDLLASGAGGLHRVDNTGGNENGWLAVRLRGLTQGNDKNNLFGVGATVEVRAGEAYQYRESDGGVVHFGLGELDAADLMRVVWTNGVPQNRIQPKRDQRVVEEQVLKGSCPFLYVETGAGVEFVTDLLWGAPLGMPVAEGVWAGWDLAELVRVDGAAAVRGKWDLRITEELWEAAFFDLAKLWVVDHPAEVEVASSLRVLPGVTIEERVLAAAEVLPVAAAWDGRGQDVTARVARRDEVYADGYRRGGAQGVAAEPWTFTFDLGAAPAAPVRLLLEGWIFPADASLNLAVAQRVDALVRAGASGALAETRLEMETAAGWQPLLARMGDPPGKTKLMMIDTPALPEGVRRMRIVTSKWLHWDRVAWTTTADDASPTTRSTGNSPRVVAKLAPETAELRHRGFSRVERRAPNAPHHFDYATVSLESPWLPFPGRYTRYGDVRELLLEPDDRHVILAPGDEMRLTFDAAALPPPAEGWTRTVFLESHGWDKDADRNTWEADQMEPLPFRAMKSYPYADGESYPDTPELRRYREQWLTREVSAGQTGGGTE